jgi:sigma-E factor negative regulatory protein RseC
MIVERARVVAVDGDACWVELIGGAGCGACAAGQGCGGGVIGRLRGARLHHLRVALAVSPRPAVDDTVEIGVREHGLLRASALAYLLPLAGIVAGAVLGERLAGAASSDSWSMAGAAAGFVLAALGARRAARLSGAGSAEPVLLRVCPAAPAAA